MNLDQITPIQPASTVPRFYLMRDYTEQYPDSGFKKGSVVAPYLGNTYQIPETDSLYAGRLCVAVTSDLAGGGRFFVVIASDLAPAPPHATNPA